MDSISRVEYNIRDLSTRSVTLFPTKAQVSRDIRDVPLRPGTNEITILGLTPTVDEHSIKVEGNGAATIVDISIEPVPNHELFADVYPDSDDEEKSDEESDVEDVEVSESPELIAAKARVTELNGQVEIADEVVKSTELRKRYLNGYYNSLNPKHNIDIEKAMDTYKDERIKAHQECLEAQELKSKLGPELQKAQAIRARLIKRHEREKTRANRETAKIRKRKSIERRNKELREQERVKEKNRIRGERESFWPKYCYAVHIKLEVGIATPAPSSVDVSMGEKDWEIPQDVPKGESVAPEDVTLQSCDLILSYITGAACWQPSYDIQLDTTNCTGILCFDAQITNTTSETWERCKVTLSTSQAAFSGLVDSAPTLEPWNIILKPKGDGYGPDPLVKSREEVELRSRFWESQHPRSDMKPRTVMFGIDNPSSNTHPPVPGAWRAGPYVGGPNQQMQDYQMQLMLLEQQNKKRVMMARQEGGQGAGMPRTGPVQSQQVQGSQGQAQMQAMQQQQQQQQAFQPQHQALQQIQAQIQATQPGEGVINFSNTPPQPQPQAFPAPDQQSPFDDAALSDPGTVGRDDSRLSFEESLIDQTGFTTTYDLPGLKTLAPRSTPTSQRVARIAFPNVPFRHTIVAKYRPAAYLSAKLQNDSKINLTRGLAGVSLDGSFLGRVPLSRCSVGEHLNLNLGVDPAITVAYPPPEVRKATRGFFAKDDVKVYERCVRLENKRTWTAQATKLFVLDQIPVAEDERLRVDLLQPEGLVMDGESKPTGVPGRSFKDEDKAWGRASAHLRKGGQVQWLVYLEPGKAVKLPLEYQVSVPNNEEAVQAPRA
ncbi:unnamed protein product [Clonostachys rhizophaga]|uniref:Protein F37C4.5 n=1 Tax=Clonostachys rhizophaga TaxID=160324 RepID=A0A9N9YTA6_9HYPO|nr:unnamed protein product [Clonostachys rhizophaga]